ncbi:hypothetical protein DAPPUDRAFT_307029 [Daphnia pulex]|uniref:Ion transport peptide-like protein n=1 Tax=Daphnia pulex TaxID=6669 RepID=E9HXG1_DAPPU|nr:hypothetical protein DAPPUDRAFT_307029 [Daphnia pulex]|eukprot:EFX63566.1 hypothetical protein DAPPUDRAFT_307029 [Daphnia pulex]
MDSGRQSHSSCSIRTLLGLTTLLVVLLAILPYYPTSAMSALSSDHHSSCKGLYDKSIFYRLNRICHDCFSLYRSPELHTLCRSECFTTPFFKACLKVLLMGDQDPDSSEMIDKIGR